MEKYWELTKVLPNTTNQEMIEEYLLSLKLLNRSEGTVIQYRRFLEQFFNDVSESFATMSPNTIQQWFENHQAQVKEPTLKMRLSILSSFYTFCVQEGYIDRSPIKTRWFPRLPQSVPKYLEKEGIAKTRKQSEKTTLRNRVLIELFLSSGCRVGEIYTLNKEDIDIENRIAHVIGKGRKIRQVHFSEKCAVLLERYLNNHPTKKNALFLSHFGERLSIRSMQYIVEKIGEEAGLDTRLHPHRFRHTFATELLAKGADLAFISDELGHTSINTTQIYARLPKREIISLYRKYMG
ncbi:tyrosine-type recombinase/integrase [Gracilibacillus sp. YIM 98692]|uniref:tyrosine-type recombinase/integrase n=1 Tax=Gracilibacillus sp. YIM 98692 TaxID=2663532 RepID=UPI0013D6CE35|nr:tyrosine-type recombinase/integrase [Gracilibacillus sp. YIM 98692]